MQLRRRRWRRTHVRHVRHDGADHDAATGHDHGRRDHDHHGNARAEQSSTTETTETAPPTTTEADLEAQIAADYVRSRELRNELTSNPTLENLDARVAEIAAVGTQEFDSLKAFVEELVALGERTARATRTSLRDG